MSPKSFFVMFAVPLDYLLYCFYLKASVDCRICHVPGGIKLQYQCLRLRSLNYVQVWVAGCSPQLSYYVDPDFVDEQLIVYREIVGISCQQANTLYVVLYPLFFFVSSYVWSMLISCPSTFRDILLRWHLVEVDHTSLRWGSSLFSSWM